MRNTAGSNPLLSDVRIRRHFAVACLSLLLSACGPRLSPIEQQLVGSWSWTYIEGVGRIIFDADRTVREGFPPDDKDGRTIADDEFDIVRAGTWRVEGDVLVTEMNNRPFKDMMKQVDPSNPPPLETTVEKRKILKIDSKEIVFDDGLSLSKVKN